jgi:predicted O-linked N-acetylglucosamine transferase (SPINDLY family)
MFSEASKKIKIGYFSNDYFNHATAYLMAEFLELHNKDQFELFAFSLGPIMKDEMRMRLLGAFDQFIEVNHLSDREIAELSRQLEIDIAIDLKGFTQDSRVGIFAYRAATTQISYLGYPGTLGTSFMDYIIADKVVLPEESQKYYSEKVLYLPNCYQVNDSKRKISTKICSRAEVGLPEKSFVFCSFNNSYKITPKVFSIWMKILSQVQNSVLWLFEDNPFASENLRKYAKEHSIDPSRLIFAERLPLDEHLARHRLADLFLDTLPYNAHTTAVDALKSCVPVLTRSGQAFAGRVAASVLNAIGLPELVAISTEEYEDIAIKLVANPNKLKALKKRLSENRLTTPLFNTRLYTKNIESAYSEMYRRYLNNESKDHLFV